MILFALHTGMLIVVCFWAFVKGSGPERAIAATLAGMLVVDQSYHIATDIEVIYFSVDYAHTAIDFAGAVSLTWIALVANRIYPLCMAAVQVISVLSHFARGQSADMNNLAYGILMQAPSSFLIVLLASGMFAHVRRTSRHGTYRSWRLPSNQLPEHGHVG